MAERLEGQSGAPVLYGFWLSPYMSLVAHILKESGIAFRYERVSPYVGATHSSAHTAKNPLGKIPTFEDANGVVLSESQAICRYLARTHPEARRFYPCNDPVKCAEIDAMNDFITFSISGPFFNWFVVSGYFPKAWGMKTEVESQIFSTWSVFMLGDAISRLLSSARMEPYLLGSTPYLPDFHLFHILELGKTFSEVLDIPFMNLTGGNEVLRKFYDVVSARPSTLEILETQAGEHETSVRELFEDFGPAYAERVGPGKAILEALFGHEV
jgi:glutathione S-transferase